jgi:hypothetical protein
VPLTALFDSGRREAWLFTTLAVLLVVFRSAVFLIHGYIDFDSDQAILGLMAKHVSEFRHFPLFYYGQNYMLGATSWVIAPFFWLFRPSIAAMKVPLVIVNAVVAVLLIRLLADSLRMRPAIAFVAALPFIVPTPILSAIFLQGVEPILYILLLWMLRRRPWAFGALLAFGFLHREFTMYALPALAIVALAGVSFDALVTPARLARATVGFAAVWLVIDDARMHLSGNSLALEAQQLGRLVCLDGWSLGFRLRYVGTEVWPLLVGGVRAPLDQYSTRSAAIVGSTAIGWLATAATLLLIIRVAWLWRSRPRTPAVAFPLYLALVGAIGLAAYMLTCAYEFPIVRYFYIGLLLPIGAFAAFIALERSVLAKRAAVAAFLIWAAANLADNARVIREASIHPEPNPHQELTDFLLSHEIRYARAGYWDSYIVDFLSKERVIVASVGPVRIPEYQQLVDEHGYAAVNIERMPCEGQLHVSAWCIQIPMKQSGEEAR